MTLLRPTQCKTAERSIPRCCTTAFADSQSRCAQLFEKSGLQRPDRCLDELGKRQAAAVEVIPVDNLAALVAGVPDRYAFAIEGQHSRAERPRRQ
jgi:hypothetical protein